MACATNTVSVKLKEYREILGVKEGASRDELKVAYKKKALQCHPDKNQDDHSATEKFQKLNEAFRTLVKEDDSDSICFDDDDDDLFYFEKAYENLFYFILRESVIQKMFEQRQKMEKERQYQNERIWQEKLKQGIAREKHQNKYKEPSNDLKESSDYMHKSQKPMTSNNGSPSNITKVIDKPPDAPVYQSVPDASFKEDIDFLNFLKKKREQTGKHEEDEEEEMKKFNSFAEWEEAKKETLKKKKKTKEKLPPRPKPLTKKEQEAQSYRRSKEAEKLHEEIMQQQQRQLLREEKRLQKEAERRHKLNEEKLHHLQEQASLTVGKSKNRNTSTVKSSKLDEKAQKKTYNEHIGNSAKEINSRNSSENIQEESEKLDFQDYSHPYSSSKPTGLSGLDGTTLHPSKKEVEQENVVKHLQDVERKMNMQEHQEIKAFEVHNGRRRMMNLRHSRQKSKEWYNSCRSPQYQQDQLTKNKQVRSGKLGKMNNWRESENNTVSMGRIHELEEVDLNDYQVKKNEKIWKYETDAANRPKAPCPNINIWEERKAKQDALQELIPSSIEDEEAMLWKAVELSRAQAVEDEELRIAKLKLMNREVTSSSEIPYGTKKNEEECAPLCSLPSGGGSLPDTKSETDMDQVVKNTYSPSGTEILKLGKHKDEGRCGFEDFPSSTEPLKLEEQNNEGSRELEEDWDNVPVPSLLTHEISERKSSELRKPKNEKFPGFMSKRNDRCHMSNSTHPEALDTCQMHSCKNDNVRKSLVHSEKVLSSDISQGARNEQFIKLSSDDSSCYKQVNCVSKENQIFSDFYNFQESSYSAGTSSDLPRVTERAEKSEHISVSSTPELRERVHENSVQFTDDRNILQENISDWNRMLPNLCPNEQPFQQTCSPVQSNSVQVTACNLSSPVMISVSQTDVKKATINNKQTLSHTHHTNKPKMMTSVSEFSNNQAGTSQLSVDNVSQPYASDPRMWHYVPDVLRKDSEQPSSSVISQLFVTDQKIKDSHSQASNDQVSMAKEEPSDISLGRVSQPFINDPMIQNPFAQQNENQAIQEVSSQSAYTVNNNYCNKDPKVLNNSMLPPTGELGISTETNPSVAGSSGLFLPRANGGAFNILQQQAAYIEYLQYQLYLQSVLKNPFSNQPSLPFSFYSPLLTDSQVQDNYQNRYFIHSSHPPDNIYPSNHNAASEFSVCKSEDHQINNGNKRANVSTSSLPPGFDCYNDYLVNNSTAHHDNQTQRNIASGDHHRTKISSPPVLQDQFSQVKGSGRARTFRRNTGESQQMRIPGTSNISFPVNNDKSCCSSNPRNDNTSQLEPSRKNPVEEDSKRANVLKMQALNASFNRPRNPRHFARWQKEQQIESGVLPFQKR